MMSLLGVYSGVSDDCSCVSHGNSNSKSNNNSSSSTETGSDGSGSRDGGCGGGGEGPLDKEGGGECTSVRSTVYGYVSHLSAQILLWLYAAESRNFTYVRTFVPLQYNIRT
ncbi:hypothetical protein M0804_009342 [Polistes exclamans]|nr:hypothetical protein M0804_009342 [Polistes exclamans]